ncbi:Transcription initiation factor TFIID subunit 5 [Varicellaria rhodocarpa]|nr:Transcription initiation factor TFIID subunit 5 [Varicellaria rhodocarpa]
MSSFDAEGRPIISRLEDTGGGKYGRAFRLLKVYIDDNFDIYKSEMVRFFWPIFVHSTLNFVKEYFIADIVKFFNFFKVEFE